MNTNSNLALRTPTGGSATRRRFNAGAASQTDPIESVTALVIILLACLVTFFYKKGTKTSIVAALATAANVMTSSDATPLIQESDEETVLVSKSFCIALCVLLLSRI